MFKSFYFSLKIQNIPDLSFKWPSCFGVNPLRSPQPGGHTFNYSCGKFDGEEKGFSPCSQYNKCNTENTFENDKIQTYFNPTLQGIANNYWQICIMNEEQDFI